MGLTWWICATVAWYSTTSKVLLCQYMKYSVWHWLQCWYDILALTIMQQTTYCIHALAIRHNIGTCPRACSPWAWCQYLTCSPCTRSVACATSCCSSCSPVLCVWLWCWTAPCTEVSQAVIPLMAFMLAWYTPPSSLYRALAPHCAA